MNNIYQNRFHLPITTGKPQFGTSTVEDKSEIESGASFHEVLRQQLEQSSSLSFSKHAVSRVAQRNIDISPENIQRLNQGVRIAEEKGLKETLILIDKTAFIVNVKNNTVVTTVNGNDLKGNVFTNIDGTVII